MPENTTSRQREFDVAVVGGGPAGLSAAVWLGRFLYDVVLIDAGDPRNWEAREIHGVLGHEQIRPARLRGQGRDDCRRYDVDLVDAHVDEVDRDDTGNFELTTDDGNIFWARRLLIASGIRDNWPDIPGLDRCYGTTVHTCPNCDGYESRNTRTAVIGAGRKAAVVARALTTWTRSIAVCTHGREPTFDEPSARTLERLDIPVYTEPIELLEGRERQLRCIDFVSGTTLECDHVFIAMGQHARDHLGVQLGCESDDHGFIDIDGRHHTSVDGVFAAGDVTPGAQLAIRAAAGGAEAALSIHHSLIPTHRRVHREC